MQNDKVDMFLMTHSRYFPPESLPLLREKMLRMDDSRFMAMSMMGLKDPTVLLVLSLLVGYLGVDRFMLGDIGLGVLKLLTGGVCGVLLIIDWFTIMRRTREKNLSQVLMVL